MSSLMSANLTQSKYRCASTCNDYQVEFDWSDLVKNKSKLFIGQTSAVAFRTSRDGELISAQLF